MRKMIVQKLLLCVWMIFILSGCGALQAPARPEILETVGATPAGTREITSTAAPEITSTARITPTPVESTPTPEFVRPGKPLSGWTLFTNPDYVQAIALHDNQLWAATLGGVVVWDLQTRKPTLITTREGLVEIQANDIAYCRLPDERILVAHPSGILSAYSIESKRWSRIPITFEDGTTLNGVETLLCDTPSQRLLVGSSDGLGILDLRTGRWKHFGAENGLKVDAIKSIDVVGQSIWIAAGDASAFMIMGNTVFPFTRASGFPAGGVNDLRVAADQSVWFGYTTGLVHYQNKKWNLFGPNTRASIPFESVDQVEIGADGLVWIASADEGVCPFNPVTLYCGTIYPGTEDALITDLLVDQSGVTYTGTSGKGVAVMDGEQVTYLSLNNQQLLNNNILDISGNSDGKIWVSTQSGINIIDPLNSAGPWERMVPQHNPMPFSQVRVLLPAANGMWLFYDQEQAASFYDGENWLQLDRRSGLSGAVVDATVDQRGRVWMATSQGVSVWDGDALHISATPKSLTGNNFYVIKQINNIIWAGTDQGLLRYQNYQWRFVLPGVSVRSIISDRQGGLLLGTTSGLIRFDGSQSYLWIINLGDEVLLNPLVTSITWDGVGQLWVGTSADGLFRYNGKRWEQFNTASGLPTNHVRKLFTDQYGAMWAIMMTGQGGGALVRYVP